MNEGTDVLRQAVSEFIDSVGRDYAFPAGGAVKLLTIPEQRLLAVLQSQEISETEKVTALSAELDPYNTYDVVIFGVRLAILAVRRSQPELFRHGVLALFAGSRKIDRRDLLRAFAVFENCSARLKLSFQNELQSMAHRCNEFTVYESISGFFGRTVDMRSIKVMWIVESGTGDEWTFSSGP